MRFFGFSSKMVWINDGALDPTMIAVCSVQSKVALLAHSDRAGSRIYSRSPDMRCRLALIETCTLKRCLDSAFASPCEFALKQW
jgi:hypothetical protein